MARWIHVTKAPFDYPFPDRTAVMFVSENGDHFLKDEIADFAIEKGYAKDGKADARSRSSKGGKKRVRLPKRKETATAEASDMGTAARVGNEDVPAADRPADRAGVDPDAG